jgi:hypothetical protein
MAATRLRFSHPAFLIKLPVEANQPQSPSPNNQPVL